MRTNFLWSILYTRIWTSVSNALCHSIYLGRIAMFAFVGYIVHANGIKFPWAMEMDGTPFPTVSSAPEAWDSISDAAKLQIFCFVGFLEFVSFSACQLVYVSSLHLLRIVC